MHLAWRAGLSGTVHRWALAALTEALSSSPAKVALPKVNGPDVFLDACRRAQHLPTVFPEAFEHHFHGVLESEQTLKLTGKPIQQDFFSCHTNIFLSF